MYRELLSSDFIFATAHHAGDRQPVSTAEWEENQTPVAKAGRERAERFTVRD